MGMTPHVEWDSAWVELKMPGEVFWVRDVELVREVGVEAAEAMANESDRGYDIGFRAVRRRAIQAGHDPIYYAAAA
jgi:hypothetical protein